LRSACLQACVRVTCLPLPRRQSETAKFGEGLNKTGAGNPDPGSSRSGSVAGRRTKAQRDYDCRSGSIHFPSGPSGTLDVGFPEVVHLVRTEEAEVAKLQCSTERPDEQPQECSPDAERSRGDGAVCGSGLSESAAARQFNTTPKSAPYGSNGPAQAVSIVCETTPPGLFHWQAKRRLPRARSLRLCAASATLRRPSAESCGGSASALP
jgi:hypothetical protein